MRRYIILAAAIAALALTGCSKQGIASFAGSYTFKTGGTVTLHRDPDVRTVTRLDPETFETYEDEVVTNYDEDITFSITPEQGQMEITVVSKDEGTALLTMSIVAGGLIIGDLTIDDDKIVLDPIDRHIAIPIDPERFNGETSIVERINPAEVDIRVTGEAIRLENLVVFSLQYSGEFDYDGSHYKIVSSSVDCRAKLNK